MHQRILCGIGTVLTVALLTISTPDSEVQAGWRHRRGGCGGGRHHGRMANWGGGCNGGGYGGAYGGGCGGSYGGGGYAQPVYSGCGNAMQGCADCGQSGGYGAYDVMEPSCGAAMEPSCGAAMYQGQGAHTPMNAPQGNHGQAPVPPAPTSGSAPNTLPDAASGNAPANLAPPTSPSDAGA